MESLLVFFSYFLPFQFAVNPFEGVDLAIVRIIIPLVFMIWLISGLTRKELVISAKIPLFFLLSYIAFATFSIVFSQNVSWSIRKLLFIFSIYPLFLFFPSVIRKKASADKILTGLVAGAFIISLIGLFQFISQFVFSPTAVLSFFQKFSPFFLGNTFSDMVSLYPSLFVNIAGNNYLRLFAIFPDPHMLSYYLGMILPWTLYLSSKKQGLSIHHLTFAIILLADLLTFSRGGYLGLFAALLVVFLMNMKKFTVNKINIFFLSLLVFFIMLFSPVRERFISIFDFTEGSNAKRIVIWKESLEIIKNNPWGVGLGNYSLAVKPDADYREPIYAHNMYLDIATETGIISLLFWLAFAVSIILNYLKNKTFKQPAIACLSIFLAQSLVENPLFSVHVLTLFLIICAISFVKENV